MTTDPPKASKSGRWQFSLRTLLGAVAFIAVGCVALKFAGPAWWTILSAFTLLLFFAALVVALVDRGPRQAFAIGFVACAATYGFLLAMAPQNTDSTKPYNTELDPFKGYFPTTKLFQPLFRLIVARQYNDVRTGNEVPNFDRPLEEIHFPLGGTRAYLADPNGGTQVFYSESPPRQYFMLIGHLLWMLLFGNIGGQFACFVYHCRASTRADES